MIFEEEGYTVIKNAIDKKFADFLGRYILLKRQVAKTYFDKKWIPESYTEWGIFGDGQVKDVYCCYGDQAMDTLLLDLQSKVEERLNYKLIPNYTFTRVYEKNSELVKHTDRFSCEISTTLNLKSDKIWPIFLKDKEKRTVQINLGPGDMLVYRGNRLEHWRNPYHGQLCVQSFLHYTNKETKGSEKNLYDGRPHLGLTSHFCKHYINAPDYKE